MKCTIEIALHLLLAFAVKEYTPEGKVVRTIRTDLPELGGIAQSWGPPTLAVPSGIIAKTISDSPFLSTSRSNKDVWYSHPETLSTWGSLFEQTAHSMQ